MSRIKHLSTLVLSVGLGAGVTVVTAAQEPLATIERIDGGAMVSDGARYVEAREGAQLIESDRLLVLEGSSATIQFADGCTWTMDGSDMLTVSVASPCAVEPAGAPANAGVQGLPDAATAVSSPRFAAVEQGATAQLTPVGGVDPGVVTLGVLAAGGLIWGISETGSDGSSSSGSSRSDTLPTPSP